MLQHIPRQEKQRLLAIADRLLHCRPLAQQAVRRALSVYSRVPEARLLPPPMVRTLLTACAAFSYAAAYRGLTPEKAAALLGQPIFAPPEAIASFLLCAPEGLAYEEAAPLLDLPPKEIENRYQEARRALGLSGTRFSEAVERLREEAGVFQPVTIPAQKRAPAGKPVWGLAAAGFALLDITALLTAGGVFFWSRDFLSPPEAPPANTAAEPLIAPNTGASLETLYYTVSPPGFRRLSHFRTDRAAQSDYVNGNGNTVTFTQQVSREPVVGFSPDKNYERIAFRNHPAALQFTDGQWKVFWFNEYYCYTLSSDLSREETLALAESAFLGVDASLQQIPLRSLPLLYTRRLAMENNDVLIDNTGSLNTYRIDDFVQRHGQNAPDAIRISEFSADGSVTIVDLQTEDGLIYCTRDTRRTPSGEESGVSYTSASVTKGDVGSLLLEDGSGGEPFLLTYPIDPAS